MGARKRHELEQAFGEIEESILPSISMMLDTLIDAASSARRDGEGEAYSAELRGLALQLNSITRQIELIVDWQVGRQPAADASAA